DEVTVVDFEGDHAAGERSLDRAPGCAVPAGEAAGANGSIGRCEGSAGVERAVVELEREAGAVEASTELRPGGAVPLGDVVEGGGVVAGGGEKTRCDCRAVEALDGEDVVVEAGAERGPGGGREADVGLGPVGDAVGGDAAGAGELAGCDKVS